MPDLRPSCGPAISRRPPEIRAVLLRLLALAGEGARVVGVDLATDVVDDHAVERKRRYQATCLSGCGGA